MKSLYLITTLLAILFCSSSLRAQKLTFSYDASGNQTERRWICINCPTATTLATAAKMAAQSGKLSNFNEEDIPEVTTKILETAPNPLTELLKVRWKTPENIYLQKIEIYNMAGQLVFKAEYQATQHETEISFRELPPGAYIFIGRYSDASKETLKIIKI